MALLVHPSFEGGFMIPKKKQNQNGYNDGANVTHHLGNDDYSGNNLDEPVEDENNPLLEGKVAYGNDLTDEDVEVDPGEH